MVKRKREHIDRFLDDLTTVLPYSEYIKINVGSYVIMDKKPYLVKGIKFKHTTDYTTNNRIIQCFIGVENTRDDVHLSFFMDEQLIYSSMDNPDFLIDLVNSHIAEKIKFVPKNKVTELLFKNEG